MELRDYQKKAVEKALQELKDNKNPLVIMPSGSGKTPVIAKIAESCVDCSGRVLIIVRNERETIQMKNSLLGFTAIKEKDINSLNIPIRSLPEYLPVSCTSIFRRYLSSSDQTIICALRDASMLATSSGIRSCLRGMILRGEKRRVDVSNTEMIM